jgi:hypothetical protein
MRFSALMTCVRRCGSTDRSRFHDINERVMSEFAALAPFGPGNARPKFHTNGVAIVDGPRVLKERHLKMSVKQNGRVLRAIQWNAAEREPNLTAKKDGVENRLHDRRKRIPGHECTSSYASKISGKCAVLCRGHHRFGRRLADRRAHLLISSVSPAASWSASSPTTYIYVYARETGCAS